MPATSCPKPASVAHVTRPTRPGPITAILIVGAVSPRSYPAVSPGATVDLLESGEPIPRKVGPHSRGPGTSGAGRRSLEQRRHSVSDVGNVSVRDDAHARTVQPFRDAALGGHEHGQA